MINLNLPINNTGYGVVGTNLFKKFYQKYPDCSLFPIGNCAIYESGLSLDVQAAVKNAQENFDANKSSLRLWHQFDMAPRYSNYLSAGLTFFELDRLSKAEISHLSSLDILFVASDWAAKIVKKEAPDLQVEVIPIGVDTNIFNNSYPAAYKDETYRFFTTGKIEIRKGHDVLHEIFDMAFKPDDNVELIIKWDNPFLSQEEHNNWSKMYLDTNMGRAGKIKFIHSKSQRDIAEKISSCQCGVFPTRAEGFGLGILEAIACNKPVITTKYSAITEFCNSNNSTLINPDGMEYANDGRWFFGQGKWAALEENYKASFANAMRHNYEKNIRINPGTSKTLEDFNWDNTICVIEQFLT